MSLTSEFVALSITMPLVMCSTRPAWSGNVIPKRARDSITPCASEKTLSNTTGRIFRLLESPKSFLRGSESAGRLDEVVVSDALTDFTYA